MDAENRPSRAMVAKLLKLNGFGKRFDELLRDYPILVALPYLKDRKKALAKCTEFLKPDETLAAFHNIYANYFSADEMLDLLAFYKTSSGQKLVECDEAIRKEMQDAVVKIAIEIAVDIVRNNNKLDANENEKGLDIGGLDSGLIL